MPKLATRAFLVFPVNTKKVKLPTEYLRVLEGQLVQDPSEFYLPCPPEMANGGKFDMHFMHLEAMVVNRRPSWTRDSTGFTAYIKMKPAKGKPLVLDLQTLLCLSDDDFLVWDEKTLLRDVLKDAKLKADFD